jgi:hypothetical protein
MRRSTILLALFAASALAAPGAHAAPPTLLAVGSVNGTTDLSGRSDTLENGLSQSVLGGLGSGLAYAGGNTFLALPDRGPNATPYPDTNLDHTVSYINRYHTVGVKLTTGTGSLPLDLTTKLHKTTLLYSPTALTYGAGGAADGTTAGGANIPNGGAINTTPGVYYYTGRSDGFDSTQNSGDPTNARFDTESIRLSNDSRDVFISDEYGPYIREFNERTGQVVKTFTLPTNLDVAHPSSVGKNEEAPNNTIGRVDNKGMEGLAITPDGTTLVGIMQQALLQDSGSSSKKIVRIVTVDIATGTTHEYGYKLTTGSGVSDIVALNDHQFLVDERDGTGHGSGTPNDPALVKQLFLIDTNGATEISGLSGSQLVASGVNMVQKSSTPFLDIVGVLGANSIPATDVPSKIEGISFGQDVTVGPDTYHTLWVANDNDYTPADSGPSNFYVFGFKDSDLPTGYTFGAQTLARAVPEPATWATMLLGLGVLGGFARRRRTATI